MNEVTSLRTLTDQRLHSAYPQTLEPALLTSIKHTADTRASRSCSLHCKLRAIHLTSIHVCHRRHVHCMTSLMATLSAFSLALARCGRCQLEPLAHGKREWISDVVCVLVQSSFLGRISSSDQSRIGNEESVAVVASAVNAYSFIFISFR